MRTHVYHIYIYYILLIGHRNIIISPNMSRGTITIVENVHRVENVYTEEANGTEVVDDVISRIDNSGIFPPNHGFLRRIAWVESRFGNHSDTFRNDYHGGIWQVDEIGFNDTQDTSAHSNLIRKYELIQEKFNIDWRSVTWEDLRKPLYSGLAARLFLSNVVEPIPSDLCGQATYWKKHYNKSGSGTASKFVRDVNKLEETNISCP